MTPSIGSTQRPFNFYENYGGLIYIYCCLNSLKTLKSARNNLFFWLILFSFIIIYQLKAPTLDNLAPQSPEWQSWCWVRQPFMGWARLLDFYPLPSTKSSTRIWQNLYQIDSSWVLLGYDNYLQNVNEKARHKCKMNDLYNRIPIHFYRLSSRNGIVKRESLCNSNFGIGLANQD